MAIRCYEYNALNGHQRGSISIAVDVNITYQSPKLHLIIIVKLTLLISLKYILGFVVNNK